MVSSGWPIPPKANANFVQVGQPDYKGWQAVNLPFEVILLTTHPYGNGGACTIAHGKEGAAISWDLGKTWKVV
jgi:hypothetical protein